MLVLQMLARTEQLMVMLGTWAHDEVLLLMMRRISLLAIAMVFFQNVSLCLFFNIFTNVLLTLKKSECGAVNPVISLNRSAASFWISWSGLNLLSSCRYFMSSNNK